MPTASSLLSAYASLSTSSMLFSTMFNQLFPRELQHYVADIFWICDEKLVRLPYGNESLTNHGDSSEYRLNIISYIKTQNYLQKGYHVFLAHIKEKRSKEKLEEKRLEDVPVIRDFPEVFPEDFPGIPPTRQVEFQIDLVPGAAPVA
ncbi:hypothetical protein Tco_1062790 [Tanacetum coccineum]